MTIKTLFLPLKRSIIHAIIDDQHSSFDYLGTSTDVKDAGGADFERLYIRRDTGTRATVSDWDPDQKDDRVVHQALSTMMGKKSFKYVSFARRPGFYFA